MAHVLDSMSRFRILQRTNLSGTTRAKLIENKNYHQDLSTATVASLASIAEVKERLANEFNASSVHPRHEMLQQYPKTQDNVRSHYLFSEASMQRVGWDMMLDRKEAVLWSFIQFKGWYKTRFLRLNHFGHHIVLTHDILSFSFTSACMLLLHRASKPRQHARICPWWLIVGGV